MKSSLRTMQWCIVTSLARTWLVSLSAACVAAMVLSIGTASAQVPMKCDANGDGVIDQIDTNIIIASLNRPVLGRDDPRDADSDGRITVEDISLPVSPQCSGHD